MSATSKGAGGARGAAGGGRGKGPSKGPSKGPGKATGRSLGKVSAGKAFSGKVAASVSGKPTVVRAAAKPKAGKTGPARPANARPSTAHPSSTSPQRAAGSSPTRSASATGAAGAASGASRQLTTRVKSARGRKLSSKLWLERQLNDPYVEAAQRDGLRSRAAYKLIQIDERHRLLKPGMRIVDLGAAPGGWSVVAAARVEVPGTQGTGAGANGCVIALDISPMEPIPGVTVLTMDFMADGAEEALIAALGGQRADGVLTDMAAPATGHRATDHLRIMSLCEAALAFALGILAPGGFFLAKVLQGGTEGQLLATMKRHFRTVRHVKPPSSRADSAELYVLATGFRDVALESGDASAA